MGDAAKQAKAQYCTEQRNVNIEAGWAESGYTYPERSDDNPAAVRASAKVETDVRRKNDITVSSEVSRGHSRLETSCTLMEGKCRGLTEGRRTEC